MRNGPPLALHYLLMFRTNECPFTVTLITRRRDPCAGPIHATTVRSLRGLARTALLANSRTERKFSDIGIVLSIRSSLRGFSRHLLAPEDFFG